MSGTILVTSNSRVVEVAVTPNERTVQVAVSSQIREVSIVTVDRRIGPNGLSAYQVAIENGFVGTRQEWLDSLKGTNPVNTILNGNETGGVQKIFIVTQEVYDQLDADGLLEDNLYFIPKTT